MEPSKALIEAGARGIYDAEPNYEDDPVAPWENVGESTRKRYIEQATACLRAAMVGVEVVYETSIYPLNMAVVANRATIKEMPSRSMLVLIRAEAPNADR